MSAKPQNEFAHAKKLAQQTGHERLWWEAPTETGAYRLMLERGRVAQAARLNGFRPRIVRCVS